MTKAEIEAIEAHHELMLRFFNENAEEDYRVLELKALSMHDDLRALLAEVERLDAALYESGAQDEVTIAGLRREVERMQPVFDWAMSYDSILDEGPQFKNSLENAKRELRATCRKVRETTDDPS